MSAAVTVPLTILGIVIFFGLYLLPIWVAIKRKSPALFAVIVINLMLGWTIVGWIVAMAFAFRPTPLGRPAR